MGGMQEKEEKKFVDKEDGNASEEKVAVKETDPYEQEGETNMQRDSIQEAPEDAMQTIQQHMYTEGAKRGFHYHFVSEHASTRGFGQMPQQECMQASSDGELYDAHREKAEQSASLAGAQFHEANACTEKANAHKKRKERGDRVSDVADGGQPKWKEKRADVEHCWDRDAVLQGHSVASSQRDSHQNQNRLVLLT